MGKTPFCIWESWLMVYQFAYINPLPSGCKTSDEKSEEELLGKSQ
jgi:hypothetical protein